MHLLVPVLRRGSLNRLLVRVAVPADRNGLKRGGIELVSQVYFGIHCRLTRGNLGLGDDVGEEILRRHCLFFEHIAENVLSEADLILQLADLLLFVSKHVVQVLPCSLVLQELTPRLCQAALLTLGLVTKSIIRLALSGQAGFDAHLRLNMVVVNPGATLRERVLACVQRLEFGQDGQRLDAWLRFLELHAAMQVVVLDLDITAPVAHVARQSGQ